MNIHVWTCTLGVWTCIWVSGLVFWVSGLVFGCLDLSLGVWNCLWVPGPGSGPGPSQAQSRAQDQDQAGPRTRTRPGPGPGPGRAQGRAQGQDRALRCLRQTSKKAPPRKYNIPYTLKCVILCFSHFLLNFANMASPAEMTITTRTASKFCAKRRAVQPPIFVLELISLATTGITDPWPECQPTSSYNYNA